MYRKRGNKTCPLSSCGHRQVSSACFSRHLTGFHKLNDQQCAMLKHKHGTRKPYVYKKERGPRKQKDYHRRKKCPIYGCHRYVKRLKPHLLGKLHNINNADEIERLLSLSRKSSELLTENPIQTPSKNINDMPMPSSDSGSSYGPDSEWDDIAGSTSSSEYNALSDGNSEHLPDEIGTLQEYYLTNEKTIEGMLEQFYKYLVSADCGNKDPRSSKQHQTQLRTMLQCIDKRMDILSLTKSKVIRDIFLEGYCKQKCFGARTVKAYLQSLDHFYKFMQCEHSSVFTSDLLGSVQVRVKNWMKTYQRMASNDRQYYYYYFY